VSNEGGLPPASVHPGGKLAGWRIGDIEIDLRLARVSLRGQPLVLDRSSYDLFVYLVEHAGSVAEKDVLLRIGWPGRVVAENTLAKAISKLRQALGDDAGSMIRSVHGYGYRLAVHAVPVYIAPHAVVLPELQPSHPPTQVDLSARKRWHLVGIAITAMAAILAVLAWSWRSQPANTSAVPVTARVALPGEDVLAVLPFRDRSEDGSLAMLAEGLAQHLRDRITGVPKLRIVKPGEVMAYRGDYREARTIARELGATLVVSGEVSRRADYLRVVVQLSDPGGKVPAWSRTFERLPDDQATLFEDLRAAVIEQIGDRPGRWRHDEASGHGTSNVEAYRAFLRASTQFAGNNDPNSQRRAIASLEQALALDPGYADAWNMLGGILGGSGYYADTSQELIAGRMRALKAMDRTIALLPDDPLNYLLRSEMRLLYRFDWAGAREDIEAARKRTPGGESAMLRIWEARYLASLGRIDEAIALDARAIALEPSAGARRNQGWHYLAKGDTRNARAILNLQLEDLPDNPHANFYLALCDILEQQPKAALVRLEHSSTLFRLVGTVIAQHELGNRKASDTALAKLIDQFAIADGYWIGVAHAWRGDRDKAFEWLERAASSGDSSIMYLGFDPLLRNLRGDPRYAELLKRLQLPTDAPAWRLAGPRNPEPNTRLEFGVLTTLRE